MADYIDREELKDKIYELMNPDSSDVVNVIYAQPSADVVEIIRCKDCKHCEERKTANGLPFDYCKKHNCSVLEHFYCIWGEKNERA